MNLKQQFKRFMKHKTPPEVQPAIKGYSISSIPEVQTPVKRNYPNFVHLEYAGTPNAVNGYFICGHCNTANDMTGSQMKALSNSQSLTVYCQRCSKDNYLNYSLLKSK